MDSTCFLLFQKKKMGWTFWFPLPPPNKIVPLKSKHDHLKKKKNKIKILKQIKLAGNP
jgi:hypothetical protein